mmetsp:Transcript_48584/g.58830  ORF Transcript_48584/g.58830 Transcript_48584/m.58830 type:complete len:185 (+) Transcript_48584:60-614(+)
MNHYDFGSGHGARIEGSSTNDVGSSSWSLLPVVLTTLVMSEIIVLLACKLVSLFLAYFCLSSMPSTSSHVDSPSLIEILIGYGLDDSIDDDLVHSSENNGTDFRRSLAEQALYTCQYSEEKDENQYQHQQQHTPSTFEKTTAFSECKTICKKASSTPLSLNIKFQSVPSCAICLINYAKTPFFK